MIIKKDQLLALRAATTDARINEAALYIHDKLQEVAPQVLEAQTKEAALQIIKDVIEAARKYDITDIAMLAQWCFVRFATQVAFYNERPFQYFLNEPLIHPERKGIAIVEAFILSQH